MSVPTWSRAWYGPAMRSWRSAGAERDPYLPAPEWRLVKRVAVDREAEDAAGVFGERIAALAADAVVDMLCFTPASARQLVDALRPTRPLLLHCGTYLGSRPGRAGAGHRG